MATVGGKDQGVRRALFRLSRLAERQRCAVVCMRHLNKTSGGKAIYRGNSSIGVIGHARSGLLVAVDPDDEHRRVLAITKCNLAARPSSLTFILDPVGDVCRIGWTGTSNYHADQLLQAPESEQDKEKAANHKKKIAECMELMATLLGEGPQQAKCIKAQCNEAGFSSSTVDRAVSKLGVTLTTSTINGKNIYVKGVVN